MWRAFNPHIYVSGRDSCSPSTEEEMEAQRADFSYPESLAGSDGVYPPWAGDSGSTTT